LLCVFKLYFCFFLSSMPYNFFLISGHGLLSKMDCCP
jgi:hypothetical protein